MNNNKMKSNGCTVDLTISFLTTCCFVGRVKTQQVQRFVVVDLSNFYFDIAKDRLYVG